MTVIAIAPGGDRSHSAAVRDTKEAGEPPAVLPARLRHPGCRPDGIAPDADADADVATDLSAPLERP